MNKSKFSLLMFLAAFFVLSLHPESMMAQNRNDKRGKATKRKPQTTVIVKKPRTAPARVVVTSPKRAKVVSTPHNARVIRYSGVDYRYHNGAFYKPYNNSFIITRPPVGLRVTVLPLNPLNVWVGNHRYYYYDGIYYNPIAINTYEVIDAPIGARVDQLPPYSEITYIDGQDYYISEGIYYKVVQEQDGRLAYEVVGYA